MENATLIEWLLGQTTIVSILGIIIYVLYKRMTKAEDQSIELSKDVIKLTIAWENKADNDFRNNQEIRDLLKEIRDKILTSK
jgi:hypothetical protein